MKSGVSTIIDDDVYFRGEVEKLPANSVIRALLAVSGLLLLRGAISLFARYCLGIKSTGRVAVTEKVVRVETEWRLFGRTVHHAVTDAPVSALRGVRFERRERVLYSVIGFGALTVGALTGMQWFLDGLHAGYPYLTAAGALIVAAGVAVDVFIYLFVPTGEGRQRVVVALGPWLLRFSAVDGKAVEKFGDAVHRVWASAR